MGDEAMGGGRSGGGACGAREAEERSQGGGRGRVKRALRLSAMGADAWRACGVEGGGSPWQIPQGARRCRVIRCVSLHRRLRDGRRACRNASADLVSPIR